ncbi:gamma carbonic anhydrase family protein [Cryptosporangium aurantiacum]|uniref:Carbonic anhydrase or acetyltransferase, isoleucine patch superfamily n=1 Tax=Cryptosporangium aurantiacum TaxID=134849 RepID=A0A1M7L6F7_9ACTN|nr:gamma carbonic anhydrase family protein [Cryptosporangium aurantiacum]SHM73338.1 Carbonic anhydrase or acetyltransferase, isoleucine patch superfamily [Cryptosporangium aurantiacum]
MILEHRGARPVVHPTAYVAPTAVLAGDVEVGPECRILFGAVVTADGGPVRLADHVVVMENAVLRGTARNPLRIGAYSLVGPHASVSGAEIETETFLATGCSVFNGARIGAGSEVRINGCVHLRTVLPPGSTVPIGWVAVGDPARILPPDRHEEIWAVQRELDFPGYVFGVDRDAPDAMRRMIGRYSRALGEHRTDRAPEDWDDRAES